MNITDEVMPRCGEKRGPRSKTRCELPPDHMVGRLPGKPVREEYHTGRSRTGRWYSWPPGTATHSGTRTDKEAR